MQQFYVIFSCFTKLFLTVEVGEVKKGDGVRVKFDATPGRLPVY